MNNEYELNIENIRTFSQVKNNFPRTMRARGIFKRLQIADFKCEQCGEKNHLTTNHTSPEAYGWHPDEIQILCRTCHTNLNRGIITIQENKSLKLKIKELEQQLHKKKKK